VTGRTGAPRIAATSRYPESVRDEHVASFAGNPVNARSVSWGAAGDTGDRNSEVWRIMRASVFSDACLLASIVSRPMRRGSISRRGSRYAARVASVPMLRWLHGATAVVAASVVVLAGGEAMAAATAPEWTPPTEIAVASDALNEPIAIADTSGAVNLFFADGPAPREPTTVLRYQRWERGRWSELQTLLASADNRALLNPALALDERGWLHAVYGGPQWRRIEYRRVPLVEINDPHAWTHPQVLSASAGMHSAVATAPGGLVYVMNATYEHHVSFHYSEDSGGTWSSPTRVSNLDVSVQACDDPRLSVDGRGRVHAVWTQYHLPSGWPPAGVYFSRSDDGGRTWRAAQQIAGEGNGRIAVIAHDTGQVHLVWSTTDGERMHVWSGDGGETWSTPSPVGEGIRGAVTRGLALAFDSAGTLHLVAGIGGLGGGEPLVETTWNGTAWSEPQSVSRGEAEQTVGLPSLAALICCTWAGASKERTSQ